MTQSSQEEKDLMLSLDFDWREHEEEGIYLNVFDGEAGTHTRFFIQHEALWGSIIHPWISRLPASQFRIKYALLRAIAESDHPLPPGGRDKT